MKQTWILFGFFGFFVWCGVIFGGVNKGEYCIVNQEGRMLPPSNLEYLGSGYDIFQGNPLENGVDPGFRLPVFSFDLESSNYPVEWGYLQPNGVFAISAFGCDVSFSSYAVEDSSSYHSMISRSSSESTDLDLFFVSFSNSRSESFSQSFSATTEFNLKEVYSMASCVVYKAWIKEYQRPSINPGFLKAVETLPSEFSKDDKDSMLRYISFLKTYGTHVVDHITMGSRMIYKSQFTSSAWATLLTTTKSVESSMSFGINNLFTRADYSKTEKYSSQTSQSNAAFAETYSYESYSIGASLQPNGSAVEWASKTYLNPLPIHKRITPLFEYSYIVDNETHYLIEDGSKRNGLKEAAKEFLNLLHFESFYMEGNKLSELNYQCNKADSIIHRGKCIKFFDDLRTWYAAGDACEEWGGNLIVFRDENEVRTVLQELTTENFWIGLNDIDTSSVYQYPNGKLVEYTNWDALEPTNTPTEECVYSFAGSGKWNDIWCFEPLKFVCERLYLGSVADYESGSISCDDGVMYDNSTCVKMFSGSLSWYESRFKCREWSSDADLVSIMSQDKNEFLSSYASSQGVNYFWIGLTDIEKNYAWRWIGNGKYVVYQNEAATWTLNNCIYVDLLTHNGKWLSTDCNLKNVGAYVCEKSIS